MINEIDLKYMKFEVIKLYDKEVLYTDIRINRNILPKNIYKYELRHDDESLGMICEIAPSILVNFEGTILSNEKISLDPYGYKVIEEDIHIEYLATPNITISEYLNRQKEKKIAPSYVSKLEEKTLNELKKEGYYNMKLMYITKEKDYFYAYAVCKNDPDLICCVSGDQEAIGVYEVPEWDFNIDDFLLDDLQDGHTIDFMPLDTHQDIWEYITRYKTDIRNDDGLQKYLLYCKQNNITPELFKTLYNKNFNAMDHYQESNINYKVIASTSCDHEAIVLAYNKEAPSSFVTWITNQNRTDGYRGGHYFSTYAEAFIDYQNRSKELLNKKLDREKSQLNRHFIKQKTR